MKTKYVVLVLAAVAGVIAWRLYQSRQATKGTIYDPGYIKQVQDMGLF